MSDLKTLLEREEQHYQLRPGAFDRLVDLRDRRRRTKQISALVFSLLLLAAITIGAFLAYRASERGVPASPPATADWSQFGYGPGRTFSNPAETTLSTANVAELHLAWKTDLGRDVDTSPVVVDGVVYVGSNDENEAGLSAVDASTGEILWNVQPLAPPVTSPAVADGLVFVETGTGTSAFDAATGNEVWTRVRATPSDVTLPPAVAGGVVYVASQSAGIAALDASSGEEIWSSRPPMGPGGIAVGDGLVYVDGQGSQGAESRIFALDASTGATVWSRGHPKGSSTPLVADGVVYMVGCAFDASTGGRVWSGGPTAPIGIERGRLFTFLWGFGGMFALDASTGEDLWRGDLGPSISLANGILYEGETIGTGARLLMVDASTGEVLRNVRLATWEPRGWTPTARPTISDGVVYVGVATTHELVALHP